MDKGAFQERLDFPTASESISQLRRDGWSLTDVGTAPGSGATLYIVGARNGAHTIHAEGPTLSLVWWRAVEMAATLGILVDRPRPLRRALMH